MKQMKDGKNEDALVSLRKAIAVFPDYFQAHFILAGELIKQSKYNDAIAELDQARRINPKDDRVYQSFGSILMQQHKYSVAAAVFAEASRLNPREPEYPLMRGQALLAQAASIDPSQSKDAVTARDGALNDAEADITKAYFLSGKKLASAHLLLASVYEKKGDRSRAANELENYLRENPQTKSAEAIREAIKKLRANH